MQVIISHFTPCRRRTTSYIYEWSSTISERINYAGWGVTYYGFLLLLIFFYSICERAPWRLLIYKKSIRIDRVWTVEVMLLTSKVLFTVTSLLSLTYSSCVDDYEVKLRKNFDFFSLRVTFANICLRWVQAWC